MTAADLRRPIEAAPELAPDAADDKAQVARLKLLPPIERDRELKVVAKRLGCRVGTLAKVVADAIGETPDGGGSGSGSPLAIEDPEPWGEPVAGAAVLDELARELGRLVVMPGEAAAATALWVGFTYTIDAGGFAPRLLVKSPEKRCGKTTLLDALTEACSRPLPASNITPASLFRTVEKARPTVILDEADTFVRDNEELRGLVNSGHRKSLAFVVRTVEVNGDHEPRRFSTWCAMAIASIGALHGTIEDRSVVVELRRKLPTETVARLDEQARRRLRALASKLRRWADDHLASLRDADPATPAELHDRAADNWRPLLAIADLAGGDWPRKARDAARRLSGGDDKETARVLLLADLRALFAAHADPEWMASKTILAELAGLDERPWSEWSKGKPISSQALRSLLEDFKVYSSHNPDKTARGYKREAFADAWARYLPAEPAGEGSIRPSVRDAATARVSGAEVSVRGVAAPDGSGASEKPRKPSASDGWTDRAACSTPAMVEVRI
jgi:putative DNA primase/helicase